MKAVPLRACDKLDNEGDIQGKIVIIERGDCMFIEKVSYSKVLSTVIYRLH